MSLTIEIDQKSKIFYNYDFCMITINNFRVLSNEIALGPEFFFKIRNISVVYNPVSHSVDLFA